MRCWFCRVKRKRASAFFVADLPKKKAKKQPKICGDCIDQLAELLAKKRKKEADDVRAIRRDIAATNSSLAETNSILDELQRCLGPSATSEKKPFKELLCFYIPTLSVGGDGTILAGKSITLSVEVTVAVFRPKKLRQRVNGEDGREAHIASISIIGTDCAVRVRHLNIAKGPISCATRGERVVLEVHNLTDQDITWSAVLEGEAVN